MFSFFGKNSFCLDVLFSFLSTDPLCARANAVRASYGLSGHGFSFAPSCAKVVLAGCFDYTPSGYFSNRVKTDLARLARGKSHTITIDFVTGRFVLILTP